ncbi:esterase-like activity of phytase family protein [Sphingorhabdus sp.]|uniref:esterase-like activity of phytase family protein n=1 Tax=Sphingorhabdus sp. TaxID=1902408 RepID=UPI003983B9C8
MKVKRIGLGIALAILSVAGVRTVYPSYSQDISFTRLLLNPENAAQRKVGALDFVAAWEMRSRNDNFGGISALSAIGDGQFIGVGDAGTLIKFTLNSGARISQSSIAPLPALQGPEMSFRDRDSEGIAHDPASGQFWVSFEGHHAIRRYSASFGQQTALIRPVDMQEWPRNKGAECIIRLNDGRFIVIAESVDDGTHPALLFSGDPVEQGSAVTAFRFRPPTGYRVTDGVQLPDGRIAIINRAIGFPGGFSAKVSILDLPAINRNSIVYAKVIASLAAPLLVDNLEGITATEEGQYTYLWLVSDNNFSIFQRTILMKFRLSDRTDNKKPAAVTATGLNSF